MSTVQINTPLDLSYLYTISDDDREFVKDMIDTIIKNIPENLEEISSAHEGGNWTEIGRLVHKLKPSLLLLNIESLSNHIKIFENNAKKQIDLKLADVQLKEMQNYCDLIIKELSTEIANDSY